MAPEISARRPRRWETWRGSHDEINNRGGGAPRECGVHATHMHGRPARRCRGRRRDRRRRLNETREHTLPNATEPDVHWYCSRCPPRPRPPGRRRSWSPSRSDTVPRHKAYSTQTWTLARRTQRLLVSRLARASTACQTGVRRVHLSPSSAPCRCINCRNPLTHQRWDLTRGMRARARGRAEHRHT